MSDPAAGRRHPQVRASDRMAEDFAVCDVALTDEEMIRIAGRDTGISLFFDHRDPSMFNQLGTDRLP
ncbi:hypothetical protein [Kocuria sp. CPCC 205263]|uniref:hypothetical protein n=1 Tax=Kocuria sp. CPCC 205263 TaxID=3073555 RepID=UPI0034D763BA